MIFDRTEPDAANGYQHEQVALLLSSHRQLVGRTLLPAAEESAPIELARQLYHAPSIVLAHDGAADPVFFYANLAAQQLFEMSWASIVRLPSRYSAEPLARAERDALLERVARQGFIDDYAGVRVASSGRRFRVIAATVWNLVAKTEGVVGQAAAFANWQALDPPPS